MVSERSYPMVPYYWVVFSVVALFPNVVPGTGGAGTQLAVTGMITLMIAVLFARKALLSNAALLACSLLIFYLVQVTAATLIKTAVVLGTPRPSDLGEPLRVVGILTAFVLGASYARGQQWRGAELFLWAYLIVNTALILYWVVGIGPAGNLGAELFLRRDGRYSGVMPSVNYVWLPVLVSLFVHHRVFSENPRARLWVCGFGIWLSAVATLLLAASRTSVLAVVAAIFVWTGLELLRNGRRRTRAHLWRILLPIVLVGVVVAGLWLLTSSARGSPFGRGLQRVSELMLASEGAVPQSFVVRVSHWRQLPDRIEGSWILGRGSDKAGVRPSTYDNSYLTTLHRYGFVGLFLEISVLLVIGNALARASVRGDTAAAYGVAIILAWLIAGIASSPWYELKTPYWAMLWLGYLVNRRATNVG